MLNPLVRWRERRIARIERKVDDLTKQIDRARRAAVTSADEDPALADAYDLIALHLEEGRKRLWFQRSDLLQKVPPQYDYEGDKHP